MNLSKKELIIILNNWNINRIISYNKATKGESNHNWIVKTSKGKFILRRAPNFRKLKDLRFELTYLTQLKKTGFPYKIPSPLETRDKKNLVRYKGGNWWLYQFIEGNIVEPIPLSLIPQLGQMIAVCHNIMEKMTISNGKKKTDSFNRKLILKELNSFKRKTLSIKKKKEKHIIFLEEIRKLLPLLKSLDQKEYSKLPQYPIHRDFNPENILWDKNRLVGVIDFENVGVMNDILISDIMSSISMAATTEKEHALDMTKFEAFMKEYQRHRKLSNQELELLPNMFISGWIEAFSWQYWLQLNDPKRAQLHRLKLYSNAAQWHHLNKDKIIKVLKEK